MNKGGKFSHDDDDEEEEGANWQDSYSDLVTDLLAIFVVLFAFAMMQQAYSNAAKSATNDAPVIMEEQGSSPMEGNDGVLDGFDSLFPEESSLTSGGEQAQGESGQERQANGDQGENSGQNADASQGADANQSASAQGANANNQGANANNQGANANNQGASANNQGANANNQGANANNQGANANNQGANANNQGANANNQGANANNQGANANNQGANENMEDFLDSTDLYVGDSGSEGQISVSQQGSNEVLLRINGSILFDLGKAKVSPNAESTLRKAADILTANKNSIAMVRIEGHTDNIPINSLEFESNWELSTFRAVNVVKWLLKNSTLNEELFSAVGYGEYHPISDNNSSEGRARNRRVDFIIELKDDETQ